MAVNDHFTLDVTLDDLAYLDHEDLVKVAHALQNDQSYELYSGEYIKSEKGTVTDSLLALVEQSNKRRTHIMADSSRSDDWVSLSSHLSHYGAFHDEGDTYDTFDVSAVHKLAQDMCSQDRFRMEEVNSTEPMCNFCEALTSSSLQTQLVASVSLYAALGLLPQHGFHTNTTLPPAPAPMARD
jgi:hypothetical protein